MEPEAVEPTPERRHRGEIIQTEAPVKSDPGDYGRPHLAVDLLTQLHLSGRITRDELIAAERFRAWFALAALEALRAGDLGRPIVDCGGIAPGVSSQTERARDEVWRAIRFLGGITSTLGECVWHVIGLDESLREWASKSGKVKQTSASTVLVVAIETLARMPWRGPHEKRVDR